MIDLSHIQSVYSHLPTEDGKLRIRKIAKIFYDGHRFAVLADHDGLFDDFPHQGVATAEIKRKLDRLMNAGYLRFVPMSDEQPAEGVDSPPENVGPEHTPFVPASAVRTSAPRPPSIFEYHHSMMDGPKTLQFVAGQAFLDDQFVKPETLKAIMGTVADGKATLKYKLMKADGELPPHLQTLSDSMEFVRKMVEQGQMPEHHYHNIRRALYEDEAIPGIGNKRAFHDHQERNPGGAWIANDLNGLKGVNDNFGHESGDAAIKAWGHAMRRAVDKTVGHENAKVFRMGGDEGAIWLKNPDDAHHVLRQFRQEMEETPPIAGAYKLSSSAGIGPTYKSADEAGYKAKDAKVAAMKAAGIDHTDRRAFAPHSLYVHSHMPGKEGPVPMYETPPLEALPPQKAEVSAPATPAPSGASPVAPPTPPKP